MKSIKIYLITFLFFTIKYLIYFNFHLQWMGDTAILAGSGLLQNIRQHFQDDYQEVLIGITIRIGIISDIVLEVLKQWIQFFHWLTDIRPDIVKIFSRNFSKIFGGALIFNGNVSKITNC